MTFLSRGGGTSEKMPPPSGRGHDPGPHPSSKARPKRGLRPSTPHGALSCHSLGIRTEFHVKEEDEETMMVRTRAGRGRVESCSCWAPPCAKSYMTFAWHSHGIPMAVAWHSHGIPMAFSMTFPWHFHVSRMSFPCHFHVIPMSFRMSFGTGIKLLL
jgi:hypothetical protein